MEAAATASLRLHIPCRFNSSSSLFPRSMPKSSPTVSAASSKKTAIEPLLLLQGTIVFPVGEPGPKTLSPSTGAPPVKLLTRVEQLRLLTKAEKAGLLSAAEKLGFSLSTIEQLGLLSKAEEFGVLSAATDTATPAALRTLSLALIAAGPAFVYFVPDDYIWQVALQAVVALACVVGGSAAFAASTLVYDLQKSS